MLKQVVGEYSIGKAIYGSDRAKLRPSLYQTNCGFHNGRVSHHTFQFDYLILAMKLEVSQMGSEQLKQREALQQHTTTTKLTHPISTPQRQLLVLPMYLKQWLYIRLGKHPWLGS
ncbi:hypothetical protein Bca4012_013435 [Brassica carinata]|uniref:Uncharacterized protein n=1 Tax=Brassica carinata TaxID=52824 RepID=A0A8X7Q2V7_BRACI|nr:hypothetical protein Bca52824_068977 [Brassica carinata]